MPYIKDENNRRAELNKGATAQNAGELNFQIFSYIITCEKNSKRVEPLKIIKFIENFLGENPNYQRYNDMVGALVCCTKELNRRYNNEKELILPQILNFYFPQIFNYEDKKIAENGDVNPF